MNVHNTAPFLEDQIIFGETRDRGFFWGGGGGGVEQPPFILSSFAYLITSGNNTVFVTKFDCCTVKFL